MRIWILGLMGLLVGCASPHATRVSCDSKLRPINATKSPVVGRADDAVAAKMPQGAP
jgi:hypothetical protein